MHRRIGAQGNNVFLGERLDAVGDRLQNAEAANAVGAEAILNAAEPLALEDRGEREERGEEADDGDDARAARRPQGCKLAGRTPTSQC
jgi:hypothetical protein